MSDKKEDEARFGGCLIVILLLAAWFGGLVFFGPPKGYELEYVPPYSPEYFTSIPAGGSFKSGGWRWVKKDDNGNR